MGVAAGAAGPAAGRRRQLAFAAAEVLRGKAMNLIAERVKVTDDGGPARSTSRRRCNAPIQAAETADDDEADDDEATRGDATRRRRRRERPRPATAADAAAADGRPTDGVGQRGAPRPRRDRGGRHA